MLQPHPFLETCAGFRPVAGDIAAPPKTSSTRGAIVPCCDPSGRAADPGPVADPVHAPGPVMGGAAVFEPVARPHHMLTWFIASRFSGSSLLRFDVSRILVKTVGDERRIRHIGERRPVNDPV